MFENSDLFNEVLLDLTIAIKRNNELLDENNKLKKEVEEKENVIRKLRRKESDNH